MAQAHRLQPAGELKYNATSEHENGAPRAPFFIAAVSSAARRPATDQRALIGGLSSLSSRMAWALRGFWLPLGLLRR